MEILLQVLCELLVPLGGAGSLWDYIVIGTVDKF